MKLSLSLSLLLLAVFSTSHALVPPLLQAVKVQKAITRKAFFAGAVTGAAVATTLGTAGVAVAAATQTQNANNNPYKIYMPPAGSMDGKLVVITGGSTGLGLESAKRLAAAGATIVLTSRTPAKGQAAVSQVQQYLSQSGVENKNIYSLVLDLDDLESVRQFPKSFEKLSLSSKTIDVLMNNAGVMAIPDLEKTKDGYERTFQSNHLGHFVLTAELFPYLNRQNGGATVINVSSLAYQFAGKGLDLENLPDPKAKYGPWTSYGQSKLANILFTQELQRRADAASGEQWLTAVTLHPGAVQTDLGRYLIGEEKWQTMKENGLPKGVEGFLMQTMASFTKTVPEGASTQVYLASGADGNNKNLIKGAFYDECRPKTLPKWATSQSDAKALWEESERLANITFDLTASSTTSSTKEDVKLASAAPAASDEEPSTDSDTTTSSS